MRKNAAPFAIIFLQNGDLALNKLLSLFILVTVSKFIVDNCMWCISIVLALNKSYRLVITAFLLRMIRLFSFSFVPAFLLTINLY